MAYIKFYESFKRVQVMFGNAPENYPYGHFLDEPQYWVSVYRDTPIPTNKIYLPTLIYSKITFLKHSDKFYEPEKQIYNKLNAKDRVSSKKVWHNYHKNSPFIPKTYTSINDFEKNPFFPVVCKPAKGRSGMGIKIIKNRKEWEETQNKNNWDVFSKKLEIENEWRYYIWRGKILSISKRVPLDEKTKNIEKKGKNEEINFKYVLHYHNFYEMDYEHTINPKHSKIVEYYSNFHNDLDFFAIDMVDTKGGESYIIEMNSEPGLLFSVFASVYIEIFRDFYGKDLDIFSYTKLKDIVKRDIEESCKMREDLEVKKIDKI